MKDFHGSQLKTLDSNDYIRTINSLGTYEFRRITEINSNSYLNLIRKLKVKIINLNRLNLI